ncbi:sulfotransferase family protein [Actinocatenispora thailandica]|uniref:Sulfotransferase family protein n=1 Tax=Actinocatenispora thailandica TaxID=227318 RepID=A0A7R7DPB1_9ACTN|nr:sulfotransferase [Actinocatenispora thailandica]BCJ35277.1 sulfotransferase family protein [Actinocatenispora thailandica]
MKVKQKINTALGRTTGFELVRVRGPRRRRPVIRGERLLKQPVFLLSSVRSGSTLLRVILDSHSQLFAPHELHLGDIEAKAKGWFAEHAMSDLGFDNNELTALLWDRLLDEALRRSGKKVLVEKTPNQVFRTKRLLDIWPDARFVFLLRHPASILASWREARPQLSRDEAITDILRYLTSLQEAREQLTGVDVRYEDLTERPEEETRRLCEFLGVEWEASMLEYGDNGHTKFRRGLGDWSEKINSGRLQPARPVPDDVPDEFTSFCTAWGYDRSD